MGFNLLLNGVYWGYSPLTNLLLTSWDIQVVDTLQFKDDGPLESQKVTTVTRYSDAVSGLVTARCRVFPGKDGKVTVDGCNLLVRDIKLI